MKTELLTAIRAFEEEYLPSGLRDTPEWRAVLSVAEGRPERHMHVAGAEPDIDTCALCGRDLRNDIHLRVGETA